MRTGSQCLLNMVQRPEIYEETLIGSQGVPIALSIWKGKEGWPCIVFLPATMTHPLFYEELLDGISREGFNVIGVHFQCHGKSPRVSKLYSFDDLVQNGKDAITYAIDRFGSDIIVMGSSQGGIVSMALAASDDRIKAVFPHNILNPEMPESIKVTIFPEWLMPGYRYVTICMDIAAKFLPYLKVPMTFYLKNDRVFRTEEKLRQFYEDPLGLTSYPLYFMASLFKADMSGMRTGKIKCPVIVVASTGDTLFPFDYTQKVYDIINAPYKEMLVFDLSHHLIYNECLDEVMPAFMSKLKEITGRA
ncbi:alpha/beta hydrolase [Methanocella sp. CWC-04]|uniref:Alpha/beta hydrolase n=1 Tax=Methanooceanicella nereidis TaxID=2052831 RepID=A0AAP2R9H6_9EURY|nr:alpha/beta fold hydrolase [Methanocella sp. CWC-04]MCD1293446.1 alpha/beta hydrolase [Methanocella sp. CWC-04]